MQSNERIQHRANRDRFERAFGELQAMIAIELNISEEKQILMHNGKVLIGDDGVVETNAETSTIASKGLQNDDMILVTEKQQRQQQQQ